MTEDCRDACPYCNSSKAVRVSAAVPARLCTGCFQRWCVYPSDDGLFDIGPTEVYRRKSKRNRSL